MFVFNVICTLFYACDMDFAWLVLCCLFWGKTQQYKKNCLLLLWLVFFLSVVSLVTNSWVPYNDFSLTYQYYYETRLFCGILRHNEAVRTGISSEPVREGE